LAATDPEIKALVKKHNDFTRQLVLNLIGKAIDKEKIITGFDAEQLQTPLPAH
jgi:hypothetical protein